MADINLTIDDQAVTVAQGATILDAAKSLGIEIPTLCHLKGLEPEAIWAVLLRTPYREDSMWRPSRRHSTNRRVR